MKRTFRRAVCLLLCVFLTAGLFAGCGTTEEAAADTEKSATQLDTGSASQDAQEESEAEEAEPEEPKKSFDAAAGTPVPEAVEGETMTGISYVMVYNPLIYDEQLSDNSATTLSTGSLLSQIDVQASRGELEEETELGQYLISQKDINEGLEIDSFEASDVRSGLDPVYERNDRQSFYHYDENLRYRIADTFTCLYEGEYCYVWSLKNSISRADAETFGSTFDEKIYLQDVEAFGTPRFTENGGKLNILCYPLLYNKNTGYGIGGCFTLADIFSSAEVPDDAAAYYGYNRDHAIININSAMLEDNPDYLLSTLSHEFQHLICASDALTNGDMRFMRTWLNEAMSAYAEELIYPGIKESEGYSIDFYASHRFAYGQSLYNFNTDSSDIGAYGAVYLFEEFLREYSDGDVFSRVHSTWGTAGLCTDEASCLKTAVSDSFRDEIENRFIYGDSDGNDEWMSKLTLEFYLETLNPDRIDWAAAGYADSDTDWLQSCILSRMLYSSVNAAELEGGGRIVFAVKDGSFTVPEDADEGLVYIGLDKDFNVVETIGVSMMNY